MIGKDKFLLFPPPKQHKEAARLLRFIVTAPAEKAKELFKVYQKVEGYLELPAVEKSFEALSNRFHTHLRLGELRLKEHDFLPSKTHFDALTSQAPFLPLFIYLDHLRSSHNVGSIVRTIEAFRLGTVVFSPQTPNFAHPKVKKTAMGALSYVKAQQTPLAKLPRPFIALETTIDATDYFHFTFPKEPFTLFLGNEEYGLSKQILDQVDKVIKIPLIGVKNSLNVACAFAIIAAEIRRQRS